jgi:hypothetical protein
MIWRPDPGVFPHPKVLTRLTAHHLERRFRPLKISKTAMKRFFSRFLRALVALVLGVNFLRAATVSEYFNDYGTVNGQLSGLAGGSGWSGAWTGITTLLYTAGTQVNYSATGYSTTGNASDANDGSATGSGTGSIAYRQFTGMTGSIWLSVATTEPALTSDFLFWLDKTDTSTAGTSRDFAALRGSTGVTPAAGGGPPEPLIELDAVLDSSNNVDFAINTPHLMLLRVDMNFSGSNDRVLFWVDPDLSGGEAGLGQTVGSTNGPVYLKNSSDCFGLTFDGIGLSSSTGGVAIDAIRISNDADGYTFAATGVPEPSCGLLLATGVALLGLRRRR